MTTFIGFNTQGQFKKFTLTDNDLIKQDLINAFSIRQGQLPGRPEYGTRLWNFVFENITDDMLDAINREVQRTVAGDPRLRITVINSYARDNGLLMELELQFVTSLDSERLAIFFDQTTRTAAYQ
jgi:phage baseplate assembly protein W